MRTQEEVYDEEVPLARRYLWKLVVFYGCDQHLQEDLELNLGLQLWVDGCRQGYYLCQRGVLDEAEEAVLQHVFGTILP